MLSCDDIVLQLIMLVFSKSNLSSKSWIIFSVLAYFWGHLLHCHWIWSALYMFLMVTIVTQWKGLAIVTQSSLNKKNLIFIMHFW